MEEADGIRMSKLKLCMWACIWSFLMTGCSALWSEEALEAESTKVYVEMNVAQPEYGEEKDAATEVEDLSEQEVSGETPESGEQEPGADMGQNVPENNLSEGVTAMGQATTGDVAVEGMDETLQEMPQENPYAYFEDALFIGDSRTVGLREYGIFENSDFFATPGLSIYAIPRTTVTVHDLEDISLEELLEKKDYGKIYLMLGMNELGYNFEQTVERYRAFVEDLQAKEPDAKLYLCANQHVTLLRTENDDIFNNPNINKINEEIRKLAEEKELTYLDVNVLFDDENGNLNEEYTSDDSHILGTYYADWCEWLVENISE